MVNELDELRERVRKAEIARAQEMIDLRKKGWTLEDIGKKFGGLSRQRVQQIIANELDRQKHKK